MVYYSENQEAKHAAGGFPPPPPAPCPSNTYVQAILGVGSVNSCAVDFGSAFFNSFCCVQCVLPDTLVLRCTVFLFCVKAALLAKRAFVDSQMVCRGCPSTACCNTGAQPTTRSSTGTSMEAGVLAESCQQFAWQ